MNLKYIYLLLIILGFAACNEGETPEGGGENAVLLHSGSADFSNFVALGNSLMAGYTDKGLFIASQNNSLPNIMAQKMGLVGGGDFTQPIMNDNIGGLLLGGNVIQTPRLYFDGSGPAVLDATPTTEVGIIQTGPYNNMGVTGAKSYHLLANGYGNIAGVVPGLSNPYFVRMASTPNASILEDALAQSPSFFALWIGNMDVLNYATSGGTGINQTGNFDPTTYGNNDITDPMVFGQAYGALVQALTAGGAQGVIANIPDVSVLPFFTTVPNNALVLDAATAGQLTGFFQAVSGIFLQGLLLQGVPLEQAQLLAAQYAIIFEEGPNRFIIDVPQTLTNPLGFRQMTENELLLLTIDQSALAQGYGSVVLTPEVIEVLVLLQGGGTPTIEQALLVLNAVSGIDDKDALDTSELDEIEIATNAYNSTIESLANQGGLAFVDAQAILDQIATGGFRSGDFILTSALVQGGAFSLDGVHPTARGYATIANEFLKAIDVTYGSNFGEAADGLVDVGEYPTNYNPALQ